MRRLGAWWLAAACLGAHAQPQPARVAEAAPLWQQHVVIPDRIDSGQALGTAFEVRSFNGDVIAAAGFVSGSQTSAINDHRSVTFWVDPGRRVAAAPTVVLPGRPYGPTALFRLLPFHDRLLAYPRGLAGPIRVFDERAGAWVDDDGALSQRARQTALVALQRVDNRLLGFLQDGLMLGAEPIPVIGVGTEADRLIEHGHYLDGRLLLSVMQGGIGGQPRAELMDCAWEPGQAAVSHCRTLSFEDERAGNEWRHLVLGFHALADGRVLLYGLSGFLYTYRPGVLEPLVPTDPTRSWQLYSTVERYGALMMGHYPSGNLVEARLEGNLASARPDPVWTARERDGAEMEPPVVEPSFTMRRDEAQSVMPLGPRLAVGMWPWGEVFEGRPGGAWDLVAPSPVLDGNAATFGHPSEAELGSNCLGMRVFQIALWRGGYVFQRTAKNEGEGCRQVFERVPASRLEPYGRVHYRDVPGLLTCDLRWTGRPRRLTFSLDDDGRMRVRQDGRVVCERATDVAAALPALRSELSRRWLSPAIGLYGRRSVRASGGR